MRSWFCTAVGALGLVCLSLGACSAASGRSGERTATVAPSSPLEVPFARTVPRGNDTVLNFSVRNPYHEEIEGIRVVFRVTTSRDPGAPEVTRVQRELDVRLGSGDVKPLEIDVPDEVRQKGAGTYLRVYALKRGGKAVPYPSEWQTTPRPWN